MMKLVSSLVLLTLSTGVAACECAFSPLSEETADKAAHVVVFQLVGATLQVAEGTSPFARAATGHVEVAEVLRGDTSPTTVEYSTSWCCGTRLDVGHYYALFLQTSEETPFVHPGNLLPLGETFLPADGASIRLRQVLEGDAALTGYFGEFPSERLFQVPRPPTPCPREK